MGKRSGGPRRGIAGSVVWIGLLLAPVTGAAASPPPPQLAVEEVLRQAVRITWADENAAAATRHRVQRRVRGSDGQWSDWSDVGIAARGDPPNHVIDSGPGGAGLSPADYAYRIQAEYPGSGAPSTGWSEWSAPAEFTMRPQCSGGSDPPGNESPGSLPTVAIGDLDGNGRYTGDDVWAALQRCSKLGGCVLEAEPVTYDDVAIGLYGHPDEAWICKHWSFLICQPMPPFPNGIVLHGHGSATVFRSPLWKTPYNPSPILALWHAAGPQLRFRNFVLDGRKREQRDPKPGVNNSNNDWRHYGLDITHAFGPDHSRRYPNGCVRNVTARDLFKMGLNVDHVRNWRIESNHVQDVGCWTGITDCPLLTIPEHMPPPGWGCAGFQVPGYGIYVDLYTDDTRVVDNDVTRVTKYGIGIKGGNEGTAPITRVLLAENRITNVGVLGIFLAGLVDGVVEHNLVDGTHAYGCRDGWAWNSWGIQTNGTLRATRVANNVLRNLAGVGIGSNAAGTGLVFADNRIDNVCVERNASVGSVQAAIELGESTAGDFTLARNSVTNNHCSMSLAVGWKSNAQVTVDGGYYSTAENSDPQYGAVRVASDDIQLSPRVVLKGGVVFDYLGSPWKLRRPGIAAVGNGRVVVADDSVRVKGYRLPFDEMSGCIDECSRQKTGTIIRCGSSSDRPECR
jgi:hypothetical protein